MAKTKDVAAMIHLIEEINEVSDDIIIHEKEILKDLKAVSRQERLRSNLETE